MRRLIPFLCFLMLLAACSGNPGQPGRPVPVTLRPSTTAELIDAALFAGTHPNTTILLTRNGRYILPDTLFIRGDGTTFDLNGATLAYNAHYDGVHGAAAVSVFPVLADPVTWTSQKDSIWDNAPGGVGLLEVARGGAIPLGVFAEPAPVQYPGKLRATYSRARKILTPATNITIKNGTVTTLDGGAYLAISIGWAKNIKVDRITVTAETDNGQWLYGPGQIGAQESEFVEISHVAGCRVPVNSSTYVTLRDSVVPGGIFGEEMARFLTVTNVTAATIRSNDLLCDNWTVTGCTFTQPSWNIGTIQLWEYGDHMVFRGNTLASGGWCGGNGSLLLDHNTGEGFTVFAKDPSKVIQTNNSWNVPAAVSPVVTRAKKQ